MLVRAIRTLQFIVDEESKGKPLYTYDSVEKAFRAINWK